MKPITRNMYWRDLPSYGRMAMLGNMYVWYGPRRGRGQERAVVYWMGTEAAEAQRHLNSLVSKQEIVYA